MLPGGDGGCSDTGEGVQRKYVKAAGPAIDRKREATISKLYASMGEPE